MGKIQIVTDSVSDISMESEKKYDIHVIPFPVVIGDQSYLSRVDFDNEGFYKLMEENEDIPKTSQITSYQFEEMYYDFYKKGCTDVILVLINSEGSATYHNSLLAVDSFFEEHPECEGKIIPGLTAIRRRWRQRWRRRALLPMRSTGISGRSFRNGRCILAFII